MIVRFDTPEEAKERFEELKKKYAPKEKPGYFFSCEIGEKEAFVCYYLQIDSTIRVYVRGCRIENLETAMKIVDLMQRVLEMGGKK